MPMSKKLKISLFQILSLFVLGNTQLFAQLHGQKNCFNQLSELGVPAEVAGLIAIVFGISFAINAIKADAARKQREQQGSGCCIIFLAVATTIWALS